ncbi:endonuclease [Patiriisocius marinistellae]|uniref:Endonuclease n=1 Tax=Patiriisocius marinistellae TaxID=2494560 RepID=A0A5J4G3E1_9FLAO|nr:S1/P1 nuclease [Patiriisocius marinistellae]GEQ86861.1 endonuclease [Patiriisocius marinistellae]
MKSYLLLFSALIISFNTVIANNDWGRTGHRVTGKVAAEHLSKKAEKAISQLLNGESLAFVSTYADEIRSDNAYKSYAPWHYVSFPFGARYETSPKNEKGDIIQGIDSCIKVLKDKTSSKEEKAFNLRMLVHFIGDLHMPLHVGLNEDKGGNDFQVRWFGDGTNLHTVWDTKMIESYEMTYTELADNKQKLSKQQILDWQQGSINDWMYESRALCEDIYANTEIGEKLGYRYMYKYVNVARKQLHKGGLRLAKVLNEIFE